ncbi:MAG: EscU/YscU/HrcU family type III secretion system export apparatus switch protein [Thalassovita sp.]
MSDDESDKSHEPSQKKLDDARKKGELVRSADIVTAAAFSGLLLALMTMGISSIEGFGAVLVTMIAQSALSDQMPRAAPALSRLICSGKGCFGWGCVCVADGDGDCVCFGPACFCFCADKTVAAFVPYFFDFKRKE